MRLICRAIAIEVLIEMRSASDFQLVLVVLYAIALTLLPTSSLTLHFVHAITWCLFQSFGLGVLLRAQSQSKFLVRHYLKHYHYPQHDRGQGAVQEAFQNWKVIYNLSMCMTYGEYGKFRTEPMADVTSVCSLVGVSGVEGLLDLSLAAVDCRQRASAPHSRCCECS